MRLVVDVGTGEVVQKLRYDAFGGVVEERNAGFQPFGFAGGLYDPDTALVRFGTRDYSPATGRWTAIDPVLFDGGAANLYEYASSDPINAIDPTGLAGIRLQFDFYPVQTGEPLGRMPLWHQAVISVDESTGGTRYYEYGRYPPGDFGRVKRRWIPDLVMGDDGRPTEASLRRLLRFVSNEYGKDSDVVAHYHPGADHKLINEFAERRMNNEDREPYSIFTNNCGTFASEAIDAGYANWFDRNFSIYTIHRYP